jgi:Restriction endonuclease/NACHT domain
MKRATAETVPLGKAFEHKVASLYRLLGFQVTQNIELPGQETDILATRRIPGVGDATLLVECKFISRGTITNQLVQNLVSTFETLRLKQNLTKAIMVTNADYTKSAKAIAANRKDVELLTIADLKRQLIDSSQAFLAYAENYRREMIFHQYVHLSGRLLRPDATVSKVIDVEGYLLDWAAKPGPGLTSVLAEYGTGKSTLLRKIKYEIITDAALRDRASIPLFFELRMLNRFDKVGEYVVFSLLQNLNISISEELFFYFANEGLFLFLLDGFDETSSQFDQQVRANAMLKLSPLIATRSKSILTCRPNYFMDLSEYNLLVERAGASGRTNTNPMPA